MECGTSKLSHSDLLTLTSQVLQDPWRNVTKSLSLVYSFGNPITAEERVFVGESDTNSIYI
jgi:hypothetical protein